MRGFSGRGTGQSRVLVLLDGNPERRLHGHSDLADTPGERSGAREVVRGRSRLCTGERYGGVINILTRPVEKRHVEFSGRYGSQDSTMYSLRASDRSGIASA